MSLARTSSHSFRRSAGCDLVIWTSIKHPWPSLMYSGCIIIQIAVLSHHIAPFSGRSGLRRRYGRLIRFGKLVGNGRTRGTFI